MYGERTGGAGLRGGRTGLTPILTAHSGDEIYERRVMAQLCDREEYRGYSHPGENVWPLDADGIRNSTLEPSHRGNGVPHGSESGFDDED